MLKRWPSVLYVRFRLPNDFQFPQVRRSNNKIWNQFTDFHLFFKNRSAVPCKPNKSNLKSLIKAQIYGLIGNFQKAFLHCNDHTEY